MLLKNTLLPVAEISFAAGFNSAEYFATAFRQKYKMNPTQYRK
jgi:AraC family transcriptional regulator